MKSIFTLFFSFFLFFGITGQEVLEKEVNMSLGIKKALFVEIEGADRKMSEDIWKKYIKDYGKTKKNKKANEWYAQQVIIPSIYGSDPIDIYIKLEEMRDMTRAYLWVDAGTEFISAVNYSEESEGAIEFLTSYYKEVRKEVVKEEIEQQEKILKNIEKEMKKLEDKNRNLHKNIEEMKEKIRKAEAEIEKNSNEQEKRKEEFENQELKVQEVINKLNSIGRT